MKIRWIRTAPPVTCLLLFWCETPVAAQVATAAALPPLKELARTVETHSDHTVTWVRVRPPKLPKAPPPAPQPAPTAAEMAAAARRGQKSYETMAVRACVYLGKRTVTELTWQDETGAIQRALSNVDFRLLAQLADVETSHAVYLWFPVVSAAEGEPPPGVSADDLRKLNPKRADYVFLGSPREQPATTGGLDLLDTLHAYVELNEARLRRDLAKREADAIAAEEKRKRTPPPSPTIHYWLERGGER